MIAKSAQVWGGTQAGYAVGCREILGIDVTSAEDGAGWLAFLRSLAARGLSGVALLTSDDRAGQNPVRYWEVAGGGQP